MWIALSPSTQCLAIESPARHSGSSTASWFSATYSICAQPSPRIVRSMIVLNRDCRLPSMALVKSSNCLGICTGLVGTSGPIKTAKSLNSIGLAVCINTTSNAGSSLKFLVLGMRNTRAGSAGTAVSIMMLASTQRVLKVCATGNHFSTSTG